MGVMIAFGVMLIFLTVAVVALWGMAQALGHVSGFVWRLLEL